MQGLSGDSGATLEAMTSVRATGARSSRESRVLTPLPAPVLAILLGLAALLSAFSGRYGYHRDELYFRIASENLAWGYIDQPPLTPALARLSTAVFGDTLPGLRVMATLLTVASVAVLVLIARELGGGRRAQLLTAGCAAGSSVVLAFGHLLATASVDLLLWLVFSLLALRLLRSGDQRWFAPLGLALGVGLLNKYLIALLAVSLLVAVAIVGPRAVLRSWWLAAGVLLALLIAAPNLWWQASNGWPQLEVARGLAEDGAQNRALFVPLQLVYLSPLFVPIWVAGIVQLWRSPDLRWARSVVVAYVGMAGCVLALGGKSYYVLPLLLVLLAAGTPSVVRAVSGRVLTAVVVVAAAVNVVAALPVLPPSALGPVDAMNAEQGAQVGWESLTATVAQAWVTIPPDERGSALIYTTNYGEAGAITRHGPAYGLPAAYSAHMSYADWGPPSDALSGPVVVVAHERNRAANRYFTECEFVAAIDNGFGLDNGEQGIWVRVCAGPTAPWAELWPALRHTS